ncbi:MAG: hypothetical protein V3U84_04230, partial [Thiotrichaceae bacterium]
DENKEALSGFESQEKLFEAINYKVPEPTKADPVDWRDGMDDELKKTADRFTSPTEAIRSIQELRKRESAVRVPGKEATDEETSAYHKAIGVPETAEGYKFELPEGVESTPEIEASNKQWGERLHGLNVPVETVSELVKFMQEDANLMQEQEIKADADFVAQSSAALKAEWKGEEYDKNISIANKAFTEVANRAGINLEELKTMETKEGRFLMDDPRMLKIFSTFGREMAEGTLGPTLTDGERDNLTDELTDVRAKIVAANESGNSKEANRLYQQELAIIAKKDGNKSIS